MLFENDRVITEAPRGADSELTPQDQKPELSANVWDDMMNDGKSGKMQVAGVTCRWIDDYGNMGYGTCDFEAGTVRKWET